MKEFKGSKGEWELDDDGVSIFCNGYRVALCQNKYLENGEDTENRYLISAAPDLLEACIAAKIIIRDNIEEELGNYFIGIIDKAIEKALGGNDE